MSAPSTSAGRILAVDDESMVLHTYRRILTAAGYEVICESDPRDALKRVAEQPVDAILTDVTMPGMDGLTFLREVRTRDLDVPVILITGNPTVRSAADAVAKGAFRYLTKPFNIDEITRAVGQAVKLRQVAVAQRHALAELGLHERQLGDQAGLEAGFSRAIAGLSMAYQPVFHAASQSLFGYEALMRSAEPTLPTPDAVLDAARRLGKLVEVGRTVRTQVAARLALQPADSTFLVNLHPADLSDDDLIDPAAPLSKLARQVILEITERSALEDVPELSQRIGALRQLGYRIAVDDLGSGYAGLSSLIQLEPDVVKLDMSLVRDISSSPAKRNLTRHIVSLCRDLGAKTVAEGIETQAELETVIELGCDLLQGYLLGRPQKLGPLLEQSPAQGGVRTAA